MPDCPYVLITREGTSHCSLAEGETRQLRDGLAHHFTALGDPCQDRGVDWPCDVAEAFGFVEEDDRG